MTQDPTLPLRRALVAQLAKSGALRTDAVARAFTRVPRHMFVPEHPLHLVYSDRALVTRTRGGVGTSSSSQPAIMAVMLEQLRVRRGMNVLEIGAGTGYNAALLAELAGPSGAVASIDIQADVAAEARRNLRRAGYRDVRVVRGDGARGLRSAAPFDRIIVTAGCWEIAREWLRQLADGGVLVLPLRLNLAHVAVAFRRRGDALLSFAAAPCGFMPMQGRTAHRNRRRLGGGHSPLYMSADYRGPRLQAARLRQLLHSPPREVTVERLSKMARWPQSGDFGMFLALQGLPLVAVGVASGIGVGSDGAAEFGPVDTKQGTLALISPGAAMRNAVIAYGGNDAAHALGGVFQRWIAAGRPRTADLRLRAVPSPRAGAEIPRPAGDGTYQFARRGMHFTVWYEE